MDTYDSFLDFNLDEVPELSTVPGGREYQLKVEGQEIKVSQGQKTAGQSMLAIRCSIVDEEATSPVYENIMLPSEQLDKEANDQRKRQLRRLVEALGWDPSQGFNVDELIGETFWAVLDEEEDARFGKRNNIRRYTIPQGEE